MNFIKSSILEKKTFSWNPISHPVKVFIITVGKETELTGQLLSRLHVITQATDKIVCYSLCFHYYSWLVFSL